MEAEQGAGTVKGQKALLGLVRVGLGLVRVLESDSRPGSGEHVCSGEQRTLQILHCRVGWQSCCLLVCTLYSFIFF